MKRITFLSFLVPFLTFGQWTQLANDMDGEVDNDHSGHSVDLNAEGNVIAIGAPFNDGNGGASGQVRVYENQSGTWEQIGADIDGSAGLDRSGFSVSISDQGDVVAIGAPDKTANGFESGQVRVFENQSGDWVQLGSEIIGEAISDHSGFSLGLSGDGTTVAIGGPDNEGSEGGNFGHVRVYTIQDGEWEQVGDDIDGEAAEDNSGYAVAINEDGSIVAIGAPFNDGTDSSAGHVRVYENQSGNWTQIGDDIDGEAINDRFGSAVSMSSDGTVVAIGAYSNNGIGHVRVLQNQSGSWTQIGDDIDGEMVGERFGFSVDLSADGTVLAIGSPLRDESGSERGQVKIYQNQSGNWQQIADPIYGEAAEDRSGFSVSLSADGSLTAIGAFLNDGNGANSGHARVFTNSSILSLDEIGFEEGFSVHPNPTSHLVTLELGHVYDFIGLRIYDSLGRQIKSKNFTQTSSVTINMEECARGIYHLEVNHSKNKQSILKILKR